MQERLLSNIRNPIKHNRKKGVYCDDALSSSPRRKALSKLSSGLFKWLSFFQDDNTHNLSL
jgi:hypothetical protein